MNRSGWRSHLTALLTALISWVGLLSLSTAPAWAAAGTVTEFPVRCSPVVITAGPDGALWFTECALEQTGNCSANGKIGRITPLGSSRSSASRRRTATRRVSPPGRMATSGSRIVVRTRSGASPPLGSSRSFPSPHRVAGPEASRRGRMTTSGSRCASATPSGASPPLGSLAKI
jgi:hypothetical protein